MCYKEHDCTVFYKNVYAVVICEDCAKDELIEITLRKERVKKISSRSKKKNKKK
jgi:hypothetical protein